MPQKYKTSHIEVQNHIGAKLNSILLSKPWQSIYPKTIFKLPSKFVCVKKPVMAISQEYSLFDKTMCSEFKTRFGTFVLC